MGREVYAWGREAGHALNRHGSLGPLHFLSCPSLIVHAHPRAVPLLWSASRRALEVLVVREEHMSRTSRVSKSWVLPEPDASERGCFLHPGQSKTALAHSWLNGYLVLCCVHLQCSMPLPLLSVPEMLPILPLPPPHSVPDAAVSAPA